MEKKPKFDPNQPYESAETVGTKEDVKVITNPPSEEKPKPKFDISKPFEPVDETVKKKDTTPVSQGTGLNGSETPAAQQSSPSVKNTPEDTLKKRNELLNKVAQAEYDDWADKKSKDYQELLKKDPSQKDKLTQQFKAESQAKAKDIDETFGKFGKINLSRYEKEFAEQQKEKVKAADAVIESINPVFKIPGVKDLAKTLFSGLSDQLPKEYAVQRLRLSKGDLGDIFDPRSNINQFGDKLNEWFNSKESPVKISREEFNKWNNALPAEERVKSYDEKAEKFITEKYGEPTLRQVQESLMGKSIAERVDFEKEIENQNVESGKKLAGVVQDLRDVKGASDFLSFTGNMIGQALYRMPVSIATGTMGSIVAESAAIYDRQIDLIAEKEGISREEVIKKGLDKPAEGQAMAVLLGSMDALSAGNVLGMFKKAGQQQLTEGVVKKFSKEFIKAGAPEAITEAVQTEGEELAAASGAGVEYNPDAWRIATSAVGGLIGGGVLGNIAESSTPESVIKDETVKPVTATGVENSAEAIQSKVEQHEAPVTQESVTGDDTGKLSEVTPAETLPEEVTQTDETKKPITDAIQERSAEEILQREPQETGETGGGRGGIQPGVQRKETPGESQKSESEDQQSKEEIRKTALGARIEKNEPEAEITERVKKNDDYVRRKISVTDQEAKKILSEWNDNEHAERVIRDKSFELNPGVRATLAANLYQDYKSKAEAAKDASEKTQFNEKAADIGIWAAQNLTKYGQETAIAGKIWKSILQDEDTAVIALERENEQVAKKLIKPIQTQVTQSKQQFDEAIRKHIEQKVTEGVEQRLKKAKLITTQKKKEISDFFDTLKVASPKKGELNDITRVIGINTWNGSIEAVKRAVLTGADIANAIQAGVDYIKEHYKGTEFNEDDYKKLITPSVEKIIPKETVNPDDIDEASIQTPGIKGKKKKDFISSVVDAFNEGTLTDEKFEELYAKKIGYKPYTAEDRNRIRELSKIIAESEKFKENGREQWGKLSDQLKKAEESGKTAEAYKIRKQFEELLDKDKDLFRKAQIANKKMQEFARAPSDVYDTLITIIQGNLLTPLSLVTNVYSNTLLQPLRFSSAAIGSGLDIATSELAKLGLFGESYKDRTIDLVALNEGYLAGGWKGTMEGVMQLKTGSLADDKALREIQASFSPSRAIARWAETDKTTKQKVNDYIEGTFGIPAEVMFRLLNLGDKPFKRAAEMARAYEIGKQKGLEGNDLIGFLAFPDEQSQAEITKAGQEATFQEETKVSQGVQRGIQWFLDLTAQVPYVGGALKVILKSQIPYVKTPLNIAIETVDYAVPPLTMARGIYAYSTGNRRQGNILIGKAIVGGMIIAATREMFKLGLLESDDDDKEKEAKRKEGRSLKYETVPPNSINISALMRGLTLQGFERKDGDIDVTFKKMGPMGILMDIHAKDMYDELKEEGIVDNSAGELFLDMFGTAPRVASSALDQSFLRGTNSFLTAIQDAGGYNTEQWLINTMGSVTSVVIPNTIATISKASDEYIGDSYNKDFSDKLKNAYLTKVFLGDKLPPKINLWGEKITGSPEGRNKYTYYLFDVTKFKETSTDDFKYKLYKQWKDDAYNDEWIPSMPKRSIKVKGFNIPVEGKDYALLCEYVGKARYSLASSIIRSGMPKELKLPELKDVYSEGMTLGKERFLLEKGWKSLSPKKLKEMSEN